MSAEFEAIISLLEDAGVGTIWCFAGYLMYQLVQSILVIVGVVLTIKGVSKAISSLADKINRPALLVKKVRDYYGIGRPGLLNETEMNQVEIKIHELMKKE